MSRLALRAAFLLAFMMLSLFGLNACGDSSSPKPVDGDTEMADNDSQEDVTEAESAPDGDKDEGDSAEAETESAAEAEAESEADGETIEYHWAHWPITLNDQVQTGNDVRSAIDNTVFAIDTANKRLFSDFDWDITDTHPYP